MFYNNSLNFQAYYSNDDYGNNHNNIIIVHFVKQTLEY